MAILNCMSLAVWLREDRKRFAAVVGSDLASGLSMVCYIKHVQCKIHTVPEEGWFGQPKYSTPS